MNFTHPHFAEPTWLWVAFAGPLALLGLLRYGAWARQQQIVKLAAPGLLARLLRSHSPARRALKHALLVVALFALGVALARPQWGEQIEESQAVGEDVLFLLDCSRSMLAADVAPDRLTRAKLAILDFVQQFGRGRVGLVAFAGQAFLQCPLTFDYDSFREALMAVDERTIPVLGTDVGRALEEGFAAMEKNYRRKIMVLLTDGEDLEQTGVGQAKALADKGVLIYAVGVGTPAGALVQTTNERGIKEPMRDSSGTPVLSRLDEATLRAIATATRGSYQPLGVLGEGMGRIRAALEAAPESHRVTSSRRLGVDRFHIPLAVGLFLLVAESMIGTRRRLRKNALS